MNFSTSGKLGSVPLFVIVGVLIVVVHGWFGFEAAVMASVLMIVHLSAFIEDIIRVKGRIGGERATYLRIVKFFGMDEYVWNYIVPPVLIVGGFWWFGFEGAVIISFLIIVRLLTLFLEDIQCILEEARWL